MERLTLLRLIKLMFVLLLMAFFYILLRSISGSTTSVDANNLFSDVSIGQTGIRRAGDQRVWVTRLSPQQRLEADTLAPFVSEPSSGCKPVKQFCALVAASKMDGIDIVFSERPPAQLPANLPWFGGFVDPTTGEVFDRLGRAYARTKQDRIELIQSFAP